MQSYKRKITYFYQYHNGTVGSTAGFLKLEIRGDKVKIMINIQEPPGLPYQNASLFFYHEAGDHLAAVKVDEVESVGGMLVYQARKDWQSLYNTERDLYTFDGVAVVYNETHYYIGDFSDKDRRGYELVLKQQRKPMETDEIRSFTEVLQQTAEQKSEQKPEGRTEQKPKSQPEEMAEQKLKPQPEEMAEQKPKSQPEEMAEQKPKLQPEEMAEQKSPTEKKDVFEGCENCPYGKKPMEGREDENPLEQMLRQYPQVPMYGATELFQCVRIHPKDIGRLDIRNWKLGVNSFLTHGFYTYQYLLLGKMRFGDGTARPIIGVPGVFSNREKYLANMFGFEQFIPVKKTGVKTGEFGYWIVEIQ